MHRKYPNSNKFPIIKQMPKNVNEEEEEKYPLRKNKISAVRALFNHMT